MTDNKKPINDKKEAKESPWTHFKNFFLNYFWFGLVLILVGMLISAESTNKYCQLLSQLLNTLGLAMFVAALFSFSFESVAFQQKMQSIVEKIVLARAFLNTLSREKKKEALHNILKPTESEIEKYSNLEDFYNTYIEDVLNVSQKNVRSNYNISLKAKYDATQDRVFTDGIYSYRLYPSEHGYTDILVGFLKEDELSSVDVFLNLPNGKRESFLYKDIQKTFTTNELIKQAKVVVNEICKPFSHVDVELRVKEYGNNHWQNVFFKAEQATDGFKLTLYCEDELTVKSNILFDVGHNYHVDISESKKELHIACHQWIHEGAGMSIIVSKPECT